MNRSILLAVTVILTLALFFTSSCSREQTETKNLEQIYREEGIPVLIKEITTQTFQQELSFHCVLSGIKESSVFSLIADEVENVYVKVGDYVEKDQVLLTFPTDNPATRYYQSKVAFENAKRSHERMQNLYAEGGISRQELDNASAAFEVSRADWEAVQKTVEVKAPISGHITKVNVRETDNVHRDDELFTISRTDRMKAIAWISEKEISDIKKGMSAYVMLNGKEIEGKVVQVDLAMDQDKRAFQAVIELSNPEKTLKPGTTVEINIVVYSNPESIVVERKDILRDGDSSFVYILNQGAAEKRPIKTGRRHDLDIEILEGLNPGDKLIIEGQLLLEQGTKVKVIQ
jgi:membrane fusion protein (multidrug efflux system)